MSIPSKPTRFPAAAVLALLLVVAGTAAAAGSSHRARAAASHRTRAAASHRTRAAASHRTRASAVSQYRGVQLQPLRPGVSRAAVDAQFTVASRIRANTVRIEVPWDAIEPNAKGQRDARFLALVDHTINVASARGMKVLMIVDGTPCWASSAPSDVSDGCRSAGGRTKAASWPPVHPADYGDIVGLLVGRYGTHLAAFEVWNEPDHQNEYYFAGPDKPQRYAAILKAAYPAAKAADPNVPVLAGSLVGANGNFLRALYDQGIQGSYDGLSIHYYDLVLASVRAIRSVQAAHGDSKPLWLAEFGWSTCLPQRAQGGHACVDDRIQAQDLADIYSALRNTRYVRAALVYNVQDDSQYDFGVTRVNLAPKPAVRTLARVLPRPGPPRGIQLRLRRRGGRVVAVGSGPAGDALGVEVSKGGRVRYVATIKMDRFNRFSLALPRALGRGGLRVKVYQYWTNVSRTRRI
jgi:hypothetical protein